MGIGKRILMVVIGIMIMLAGLLLILITLGLLREVSFFGYTFVPLLRNFNYTALGFLILVLGVLVIVFWGSTREKEKMTGSIFSHTEIGEIRVSFKAIENMVLTAAKKIKGVREVTTNIESSEQGLLISLHIKALSDLPLPDLVKELQETVREYVQEISGTNVVEIKVNVENIVREKN
jgi:uncharacterized alkaline shock family protein YloU